MGEAQRQTGSCQCGAVAYEVEADISKPVICNCSHCRRLGVRLAFAPETAFTLLRGEEALTEYMFNNHKFRHQFCRICGIQTFAFAAAPDGTPTVAINVNCLDGVDVLALPTAFHDGAAA